MSRGSNLKAMAEHFRQNDLPVQISFVVRTRREAPIADVCKELGVTCHHIPYKNQIQFEENIFYLCQYHGVHLIALAGFLKRLSPVFLRDLAVPVVNIHPALLPQYGGKKMYGMAVHQAVFEHFDNESGATVHLVDSVYDNGPAIAQEKVDISACQSPEEIAAAVLKTEHRLYGKTIWEYLNRLYG